jgi:hypothetical protein
LFNQQQCFIYSTASFLSKLRAKKVEKLLTGNFENEILEQGTTISGFADKKKKKKINADRPTLDFFYM